MSAWWGFRRGWSCEEGGVGGVGFGRGDLGMRD